MCVFWKRALIWSKWHQCDPKAIATLPQRTPRIPKVIEIDPKVTQKCPESDPKVTRKWSKVILIRWKRPQSDPHVSQKWSRRDRKSLPYAKGHPKRIPEWSKSNPNVVQCHPHTPIVIAKCVQMYEKCGKTEKVYNKYKRLAAHTQKVRNKWDNGATKYRQWVKVLQNTPY